MWNTNFNRLKITEIWKFVGSRHSIWFVWASGLENTLTYEAFIGITLNFVSQCSDMQNTIFDS
jgi:hypothetical protein